MAKDKNNKPYINHGNAGSGGNTGGSATHVGPQMVDDAPGILKKDREKNEAFTQTPPPNYQVPPGNGQVPPYGQAAAASNPYYSYSQNVYSQGSQKKNGWWKGLLIFGIIVAVLVFLGFAVNSFFSNLFTPLTSSYEESYEIPDSDYIARIGIEGELTSSNDDGYLSSGSTYYHQFTLDAIDDLIDDSNNKAMLLFVDTPGGGVYESDELYLKIREYQEETKRPVYVAMGSMAASGGYYISAPADKILANRNCWTGSIGVTLGTQFDISGFLKKNGITAENLTSGKNKAMGSYVEPMTKEQRQIFMSLINEAYDQFVGIISEGRSMSIEEVKKIGDGRIYTAQQAQNLGLIDGIATEEEATKMLKDENDLKDCEVVNIENYTESSWLDEFIYTRIDPIIENLSALGKGDLGTALDLASENDETPLKYLYVK